jgi:hypothetical protein
VFEDLLVVLGPHVAREEGALFPRLARDAELADHVALLEGEHAGLYDDVDDLDAVAGTPVWRTEVLAVLHDLDEHMFKEDFGLFPAALASLSGDDWDDVDRWEAPGRQPSTAGVAPGSPSLTP